MSDTEDNGLIAVIGLAGRFPEAETIDAFWQNLRSGENCLHKYSDAELDELGIPAETYNAENFVRAGSRLPYADCFDASFFGFTPREAGTIDPQCRVFLETCYEALENAGCDPFEYSGDIGVFAGSNPNDYATLLGASDPRDSLSAFDQLIGSDKDFLSTRVSHRLNLRGPSMTVQTACSTSLVAIHMAAQSLLAFECTAALAGGVCLNFRQGVGYFHQQGMILSPEGRCRAFDAEASGTTLGQACGVVMLKRLEDALDERDHIYAVIRATAINNDGSDKVGYTAPSEKGQAAVIEMAQELAGISPDQVGYVETHGTGTHLGDPIEIAGLARAFSRSTQRTGFCSVGSVKSNIGHTDAAAGVSGFIKSVLCLHHKTLVPSLGFDAPNPAIDFDTTPFYVGTTTERWKSDNAPRIAGVSAFGIGGTNAHVVISEAPKAQVDEVDSAGTQLWGELIVSSAKTEEAADEQIAHLQTYLAEHPDTAIDSVAFTLRFGRSTFRHRRAFVVYRESAPVQVADRGAARSNEQNSTWQHAPTISDHASEQARRLVWVFSGQGAQYLSMAQGLYDKEPEYAERFDYCVQRFEALIGENLRDLLFGETDPDAEERLQQTAITQPALFCVEHALAHWLGTKGLIPTLLIGHSIGEYAAAVQAGIVTLEDAIDLVASRGKLMQSMAPGKMLALPISSERAVEFINSFDLAGQIELAAINSTSQSVLAGPEQLLKGLVVRFADADIDAVLLRTSHAFHSQSMDSAVITFESVLNGVKLSAPLIPLISNVTGRPISDEQATSAAFWASQIRQPVAFAHCVSNALMQPSVFMELGPGTTLCNFIQAHDDFEASGSVVVPTVRHVRAKHHDALFAMGAIGQAWCAGVAIDWSIYDQGKKVRKVPLPSYPFKRDRHWAPAYRHILAMPQFGGPDSVKSLVQPGLGIAAGREPLNKWLYKPAWNRRRFPDSLALAALDTQHDDSVLAVVVDNDRGNALLQVIHSTFKQVHVIRTPTDVDLLVEGALRQFIEKLHDSGLRFDRFIQGTAMGVDSASEAKTVIGDTSTKIGSESPVSGFDRLLANSLLSALEMIQAGSQSASENTPLCVDLISLGAHDVTGDEILQTASSTLSAVAKVAPLEYPNISVRQLDIDDHALSESQSALRQLLTHTGASLIMAQRRGLFWQHDVVVCEESDDQFNPLPIRKQGRYLIVGGLGGVGLSVSHHLAERYNAHLVLTSRRGRPVTEEADLETLGRLSVLEAAEASAASLEIHAVDITDAQQMAQLVETVETQSGTIDGVIVAAGVSDQSGAIHRRSRAASAKAMESKVIGTNVLMDVFASRDLDFMLLSSSIATQLFHNRFAQVGYVAANAYVEAVASHARSKGVPAVTVAWDDWLDVGMSVRAAADFGRNFGTSVNLVDEMNSFSPSDGVQLFERALRQTEPVLYVSPTNLNERIRQDVHAVSPFLQQALDDQGAGDLASTAEDETLEQQIQAIWLTLLGIPTVATDDDFFDLGGDSLQVARMGDRLSRQLGMSIPLNIIFDNSRFDELVAAISVQILDKSSLDADQKGELESESQLAVDRSHTFKLAPAQSRFFERDNPEPDHFNISVLLEAHTTVNTEALEAALTDLLEQNEALRIQLQAGNSEGSPQQIICPLEAEGMKLPVVTCGTEAEERVHMDTLQRSLNLLQGNMMAAALYRREGKLDRLLLIVHHFVSDRVSLLRLLDCLDEFYQARQIAYRPPLSGTNNFPEWIARQTRDVQPASIVNRWADLPWNQVAALPTDRYGDRKNNKNSSGADCVLRMSGPKIAELLKYKFGRPDEILIASLGEALAEWTSSEQILIDVLGHGRRLFEDLDVSSTTGFFLTYSPVLLDFETQRSRAQQYLSIGSSLADGWQFDALRNYHSSALVREKIASIRRAQVLFNFVGRDITVDTGKEFQVSNDYRGVEIDQEGLRDHLLSILAIVENDTTLVLRFVYSKNFHDQRTIEHFSELVCGAIENAFEVS